MQNLPERAWAEISLDAIRNNLSKIKSHLGPDTKINGVVKADGYGHGAIMTAGLLCENGVDMLSVATLDEAIQLRKSNIEIPLLVLGYTETNRIEEVFENNIIVTLYEKEQAKVLSDEAVSHGCTIEAHIKIDTGMNRIGFRHIEEETIINAYRLKGIDVKGTFTHFSTADEEDTGYTDLQYGRFIKVLDKLRKEGIDPGICHSNNSGATVLHPGKKLDMIRVGLLLYGMYPSSYSGRENSYGLTPAMTLKARIIQVKTLEKGESVSYGNKFTAERRTRIATISCGYADGFSRALSGKTHVLVNGCRAPVIGSICMDMFMVDVTDTEGPVKSGDTAVLFDDEITAGDIASMTGTINYEVVSRVGIRIPRVYTESGRIVNVNNYLL